MFLLRFVLILILKVSFTTSSTSLLDPDEVRNIDELVKSRGFVLKKYYALTDEGYLLTVHCLVTKDFNPANYNRGRKPVIAFHGVMGDASLFLINSPFLHSNGSFCGDNFGFCGVLSGRYDVWLPNARGNRYSRRHLKYSDKDRRFWEFSWDYIALYDIPAFVDLIRTVTGHKTLGWVGYSQGAGTLFALMSLQPEYANIIRPFICWAPAVYFTHAKTVIGPPLLAIYKTLEKLPGEFIPSKSFINPLLQYPICHSPLTPICGLLTQLIFGPTTNFNFTRILTYFHQLPSSTSNWQIAHYGQLGHSGRFTRFDYGDTRRNMVNYGQAHPPEWPLNRIPKSLQIIIMYGNTDWFVDPADAMKLIQTLRTLGFTTVIDHNIPSAQWNHVDYIMGQGAGRLVFDETLRYLDEYSWE